MSLLCQINILLYLISYIWASSAGTTCDNHLRKKQPYIIEVKFKSITITSCSKLVSKYTVLCRDKAVGKQLCCKACKTVKNIDCLDDFRKPASSLLNGDIFENCAKYVKLDPCRCTYTRHACCRSCKDIGVKSLKNCNCRDMLNSALRPAHFIYVDIVYGSKSLVEARQVTDCKDIIDWFPMFCRGPEHYKIHSTYCCDSCTKVDPSCVDNLYWLTTIRQDHLQCQNCTCHHIRQFSKSLMYTACHRDISGTNLAMGAREACCHQCARLGFKKPAHYKADDKIKAKANIHIVKSVFEELGLTGR